jgi:putative peptidoglycan lipid II flippase
MQIDSGADVGTKAHRPGKFLSTLLSRPLVRDTLTTTILSTFGKAVGFLIPFFIAAWFGISSSTDAFFFAYGIILFISQSLSPVIESVIVPYINELKIQQEDIGQFIGKSLSGGTLIIVAIIAFLLVALKPLLPVVLPSFSPKDLALTYFILLEAAPLIIFMAWTSILAGTLNAFMSFNAPALSPAFRAIVTIGFIFLLKNSFGVHSIIIGYIAGEIFRFLILLIMVWKFHSVKIRFSFGWSRRFREFLKTSSYQTMGMSLFMFSAVANRTMASWLGGGSISLLEYAERIYLIPVNFIGFGLIVTILSHWSRKYYQGGKQKKELERDVIKAVKVVFVLCTAITFLFIYFKKFLLSVMLGHGKFPRDQLVIEGEVLACFLLGFVFNSVSQVYMRAYLVLKKTNIIFMAAAVNMVIAISLNLVLMKKIGVAGIALSASISSALVSVILAGVFHRLSKEDS